MDVTISSVAKITFVVTKIIFKVVGITSTVDNISLFVAEIIFVVTKITFNVAVITSSVTKIISVRAEIMF